MSESGLRQYEIMPVAGAIAVRNVNAVTPNAFEYYQFSAIKSVVPVSSLGMGIRNAQTNQRLNPVRHNDELEFVISFIDENDNPPIRYHLSEVSNQAGWTNDFTGLQQAVSDINGWIGASVTSLSGVATEATLGDIKLDTANLNLGTSSTVTSVASSATNQTLQAANASRKSLVIYNGSDVDLLVKHGAAASAASFTWNVYPGEHVVIDDYNGIVDAISSAAPTGNILVTETVY